MVFTLNSILSEHAGVSYRICWETEIYRNSV
jgi:hypothetical protein